MISGIKIKVILKLRNRKTIKDIGKILPFLRGKDRKKSYFTITIRHICPIEDMGPFCLKMTPMSGFAVIKSVNGSLKAVSWKGECSRK